MNIVDAISAYDESAQEYAESQRNKVPEKELSQFLNLLKPGAKILDAGCGSGRDSRVMQDRGFAPTGIDLSKGLLAIAKKENPDLIFSLADIRKVPANNSSLDGIWANAVLHHLNKQQMQVALAEFNRLLVTGGVLCVRTKKGKGDLRTKESAVGNQEREFTLLEPDELSALLTDGGFEKIDVQTKESKSRPGLFWLTATCRKAKGA